MNELSELYTCNEAAKILGLTKDTIRVYCTRKKIGTKKGPIWLLNKNDLDTIKSFKGKIGRPIQNKNNISREV